MDQQRNLSRRHLDRPRAIVDPDPEFPTRNDLIVPRNPETKRPHGWYSKITMHFHNLNGFIVVFAGCLFFYGMSVSYTNSMLVSIQRRFGFSTTQIGLILAMTEVGHICAALLVAHLVGNRHRPLWICIGGVLEGLALLLFAAPEIIFPRHLPRNLNRTASDRPPLCLAASSDLVSNISMTRPLCGQNTIGKSTDGPLAVFLTANILSGVGSTTPLILGLPYVDDNCPANTVSLYYGFALAGRLIGPLVGFGVGAACSTVYIDFTSSSTFSSV
ncbi:hypothetical protein RvY_12057-3 [Ramazzottius varieornatus]|uniref:Major facilitator superfamily (MFS) profile domain-containing protein n=1 Tax=Ramazzottius varieornatus TaxID=947166 RepID=A0A1D1VI61_RAMVA|nr:hypothetical protein RvY_12057-3 [Ramazzottius varieornatus]